MNCSNYKYKGLGECKESLMTPRKQNSANYQRGLQFKKLSEQAKKLKLPWQFLKFDIMSILAFRKFELESR